MTVVARDCSLGADALAALTAGLAAAAFDAPAILADDFVGTVRQLTGSDTYHVDRGAGTVGAKTLNLPDGPHHRI